MNAKRAIQILTSLVQGIDPSGGGELPPDTVLQRAEVLRALLAGVGALEETAARQSRRANLPANVGSRWTADEERGLVEAFHGGEPLEEIGKRLGRTVRAIEARLLRLGLITAEERKTQDSFGSNA